MKKMARTSGLNAVKFAAKQRGMRVCNDDATRVVVIQQRRCIEADHLGLAGRT